MSGHLLDGLDDDELDAVVAHELGHVRGLHDEVGVLLVAVIWALTEPVDFFEARSYKDY
ncbi:M48 family metalloprotease [Frankia sp. Cr2]|uniref:M48 family metalloprotease n=1 Tax=Frankia sp. Cr2 TaxID=3073932 RepID=UPI002AD2EBDE|nr:M48 family metalloprotease [Frankia sp. Cr2]